MLILRRGKDEAIVIDDNIVVKVVGIKGNYVNLGIDAPKDISVHRTEAVCKHKKPAKDE